MDGVRRRLSLAKVGPPAGCWRVAAFFVYFFCFFVVARYTLPTAWATTQLTTPSKLHDLYKTPNRVATNAGNSQAIVSFEEQYWSHADLNKFFAATGTKPITPTIIGFNDDSNPGGEASLDIQWIAGVGQGVPTTTWSFPDGDYILDWALAVANTSAAPLVRHFYFILFLQLAHSV